MDDRVRDVFGWLDHIRARPAMYVRNQSLQELETLIWGYYVGLAVHGIIEAVPQMGCHFRSWLRYRTRWSLCLGWADALEQHYPKAEKAFTTFFNFVDEYRQLQPVRIYSVRLGAKHNPTGKRVCIGFDGRMPKPRRVDIVRYRPEPLHFLRFYYRDRVEDGDLLMTGLGEFRTTVRFAKRWARDELQVESSAWEPIEQGRV